MQRCLTPGVIQAFSMDNTGQRIKPHAAAALLCGSTEMPYKYLFVLQTLHSGKELSTNNTESYTHTHTHTHSIFSSISPKSCFLLLLLFYASLVYMQPLRFVIRINSCADMLGFFLLSKIRKDDWHDTRLIQGAGR
ncbi:Hypothetical predicted protein [Podarcis lilfordi]|uniref:Uncharacterized protein n=1 Tax=Podarcis lilfordi TaxID=74358 RepID=A0AA35NWI3_9SAUR|nr:Hypothetical predicted protein [Podarcis lilfordi]